MKSISLKPELKELYRLNEFILNELPEENLQVNLILEELFVNIVNYSKAEYIKPSRDRGECISIFQFMGSNHTCNVCYLY